MHIYPLQRDRSGLTSSPLTDELQPIFLSRQPPAHDEWKWADNDHDKYRWREHEGRGYWNPKGVWIGF